MKKLELLYQGSAKNIWGEVSSSEITFEFTDYYSIFDWGRMPDEISDKGKSLAMMGSAFFKLLEDCKFWKEWDLPFKDDQALTSLYEKFTNEGIRTHFLHCNDNKMVVERVNINQPEWTGSEWDYSVYKEKPTHSLVPLEVIFRFGLPEGSSLIERGKSCFDYLADLGLERAFEGQVFDIPLIEYSTKLEDKDRYLRRSEAKEIACLSNDELKLLSNTAVLIALRLKDFFNKMGIELWDGKFEFSFTKEAVGRGFKLVDSIGPDELRLTYNNVHLSKETLRQAYRNTSWHLDITHAKKIHKRYWKNSVLNKPEPLAKDYKKAVEDLYRYLCNQIAVNTNHEKVFDLDTSLDDICKRLKR